MTTEKPTDTENQTTEEGPAFEDMPAMFRIKAMLRTVVAILKTSVDESDVLVVRARDNAYDKLDESLFWTDCAIARSNNNRVIAESVTRMHKEESAEEATEEVTAADGVAVPAVAIVKETPAEASTN